MIQSSERMYQMVSEQADLVSDPLLSTAEITEMREELVQLQSEVAEFKILMKEWLRQRMKEEDLDPGGNVASFTPPTLLPDVGVSSSVADTKLDQSSRMRSRRRRRRHRRFRQSFGHKVQIFSIVRAVKVGGRRFALSHIKRGGKIKKVVSDLPNCLISTSFWLKARVLAKKLLMKLNVADLSGCVYMRIRVLKVVCDSALRVCWDPGGFKFITSGEVEVMFDEMPERNLITWNRLQQVGTGWKLRGKELQHSNCVFAISVKGLPSGEDDFVSFMITFVELHIAKLDWQSNEAVIFASEDKKNLIRFGLCYTMQNANSDVVFVQPKVCAVGDQLLKKGWQEFFTAERDVFFVEIEESIACTYGIDAQLMGIYFLEFMVSQFAPSMSTALGLSEESHEQLTIFSSENEPSQESHLQQLLSEYFCIRSYRMMNLFWILSIMLQRVIGQLNIGFSFALDVCSNIRYCNPALYQRQFTFGKYGSSGMQMPIVQGGIKLLFFFLVSSVYVSVPAEKGFTGFFIDFLLGGVSATVSKTVDAPIERVKLLIQNQDKMIKYARLAEPYKSIGDCSLLKSIDLSSNDLTEDIPFSILKLKQSWKNNELAVPIPSILSISLNLKVLDLAQNKLFDDIPRLIYWNEVLQFLGLRGSIPHIIGNCTSFQVVDLSYNQLSGEIPFNIGFLKLATLSLQGNCLSGSIPPVIGQMQTLAVLDLSCNKLSGFFPPILGNLTYKEILYIQDIQLTGFIPLEWGNTSRLHYLEFSDNRLTGLISPELGKLVNCFSLAVLNVSDNNLSVLSMRWIHIPEAKEAKRARWACYADTDIEPPMLVINTIISVMAYDYPADNLSVYLSDDGRSLATFFSAASKTQGADHKGDIQHFTAIKELYIKLKEGVDKVVMLREDGNEINLHTKLTALQMVNCLMECVYMRSISGKLEDVIDIMENFDLNQMEYIRGVSSEALQTAKSMCARLSCWKFNSCSHAKQYDFCPSCALQEEKVGSRFCEDRLVRPEFPKSLTLDYQLDDISLNESSLSSCNCEQSEGTRSGLEYGKGGVDRLPVIGAILETGSSSDLHIRESENVKETYSSRIFGYDQISNEREKSRISASILQVSIYQYSTDDPDVFATPRNFREFIKMRCMTASSPPCVSKDIAETDGVLFLMLYCKMMSFQG